MKLSIKHLLILFFIPATLSAQPGLDTLSLKTIFYEPLLAGNRAELAGFAPVQPAIYYFANDSAMMEEELFMVSFTGKNRHKVDRESVELDYEVSFNEKKLAYSDEGDIWLSDIHFNNPHRVIATSEYEYDVTWGPDSLRFAFIQGGDVMIMDVKDVQITQVTDKNEEASYSIMDWAGSNRLIVRQYDNSEVKTVYFPEYIGEFVQPGKTKRGIGRKIISVAYLKADSLQTIYEGKKYVDIEVSANGRYLALDKINTSMKDRTIEIIDLKDHSSTIVFSDSTSGWFYGTDLAFAPEGNRLMFQSEQDGWNHIYTVQPDGSNLTQHTEGEFEVPWAAWVNGNKIVFASTKVDPGERHLYLLNIKTGEIEKLTSKTGYRQNFSLSRDRQHVVYQYTYFNQPFQLYALNLNDPDGEIQLTYTVPERFKKIEWQKPDYFRFTGRDGETKISMRVLEPRNMKEGEQYPVVVFVHGAGSLQNVYKGWSDHYYREYMFNQWLTEHGYYVMQVDYRHSTGYGRDFRDAVTGWMGKYETQDIIDGIKYLAEHYPQADTSRVGIYGGSYGGFMALYATSVAPEYFDAAAALRAVTNWVNYYHTNPWYTKPRLGTPEDDSLNYARSSPITYVDSLRQPVLILHGLMDNNVGFQDAAQYIHKLIQAGDKEFYMMMYPAERHSFKDPDAWYDEYSRIYEFFEEQLK